MAKEEKKSDGGDRSPFSKDIEANWSAIKDKVKAAWGELADSATDPEEQEKAAIAALKTQTGQPVDAKRLHELLGITEGEERGSEQALAREKDSVENTEFNISEPLAHLTRNRLSKAGVDWHAELRRRFQSLPEDYDAARQEVLAMRHAFFAELASDWTTRLNLALRSQPQDTYAEKQTIATTVNRELREMGLAIKCPKTGRPAILVADQRDATKASSRFRLEVRDEAGKRTRTISSETLPEFTLMEAEMRAEPIAKWTSSIRSSDETEQKSR